MVNETEKKDLKILLKESWKFFSRRWAVLFKLTLFIWVPVVFIFSFLGMLLFDTYNKLKYRPDIYFSPKVLLALFVLIIFLAFMISLALILHQITRIKLIDILLGKPKEEYYLNYSALIKEAWPDFWVLAYTDALVFICVFMGLLLLVVPGLLFMLWFALVPYEVVLKKKRKWDALKSSKEIVRHSIGKYIGNILIMFLILVFINISITGFFQLVMSPFNSEFISGMGEVASTIISNILAIWGAVFNFMLYKELVERYEGKKTN